MCSLWREQHFSINFFCLVLISYSSWVKWWWYSAPSDITLGRSLSLALEKRRASLVVWGSVPLEPLCLSRPVSESGQSDMLISLFVSVFRSITYVARYTRYQSAFEWCNHLSIITYWSGLETTQLESYKDARLVNKYYSGTQIIEARRVRESDPTTF